MEVALAIGPTVSRHAAARNIPRQYFVTTRAGLSSRDLFRRPADRVSTSQCTAPPPPFITPATGAILETGQLAELPPPVPLVRGSFFRPMVVVAGCVHRDNSLLLLAILLFGWDALWLLFAAPRISHLCTNEGYFSVRLRA
jgi:hypothetical protein